jgi:YHS domain-containing protein
MKSKLIILTAITFFSLSGYLFAHEGMKHDEGMEEADHQKQAMTESSGTTSEMRVATEEDIKNFPNVGNKLCPVTGNPVDDGSMGETVKYVYNGKIYNLCCKMCAKDFKKDPEKYSKIAEDKTAQSMTENEESKEDHSGHDHKHHE